MRCRAAGVAALAFSLAAVTAFVAEGRDRSKPIDGLRIYSLPSDAMSPSIQKGESILGDDRAYMTSDPLRGDIVIYRCPAALDVILIKRVVGLPFETIEIRHKKVLIDGKELAEPYAVWEDDAGVSDSERSDLKLRDQFGPMTLKAGEYFTLSDNRDRVLDSRRHGPVMRGLIHGRAVRVQDASGIVRDLR